MGCSTQIPIIPFPRNICGPGDDIILGDPGAVIEADCPNSCFATTSIGAFCPDAQVPLGVQQCFGATVFSDNSTEWIPGTPTTQCGMCSSCFGIEQGNGNGACGFGSGSCSWAGLRYRCKRDLTQNLAFDSGVQGFAGNAVECCRRSQNVEGSEYCFDGSTDMSGANLGSTGRTRTCHPKFRGFLRDACTPVMEDYCSSDDPVGLRDDGVISNMQDKWTGDPTTRDCLRFAQENADVGNLDAYQPVINAMVNRYLNVLNKPITSQQTDGANNDPFIDEIVRICRTYPGACDAALTTRCQSVTRDELSQNVNLANLCGCFMPDEQYAKFSSFGVQRVCDPACVLGSAVHILDATTEFLVPNFEECKQSICIIDDVTLQVLANSASGDISFTQACGSCANNQGEGSCRCYIQDVTVQAVNSRIGDVSFSQTCGTPLCYNSNPIVGGPPIAVDCETGVATGEETNVVGGGGSRRFNALYWVIALIVLVVLLLFIILYVRTERRPRDRTTTIVVRDKNGPATPARSLIANNSRTYSRRSVL